jgi:hypothetical protein
MKYYLLYDISEKLLTRLKNFYFLLTKIVVQMHFLSILVQFLEQ